MSVRVALLVVALASACTTTRDGPATGAPTPVSGITGAPSSAAPTSFETPGPSVAQLGLSVYPVGKGQGPHDVAPAADGGVWYTAQRTGELGHLDPKTGATRMVKLGNGSAPHGVIVGPDGNPWITDGGLNAIVRVDAKTSEVTRFSLPGPNVDLNTATFDKDGTLWFTGQSGIYGYLKNGTVTVMPSPRGAGPYGITTCSNGSVYYASLAGSHIAAINRAAATATPIDPPTKGQGARRVWCDSRSNVWVSEWNVGQVGVFLTATGTTSWKEWKLPGTNPMAYAVFVDDQDIVWLTDFGGNALVRFDPTSETFTPIPLGGPDAAVRQLLGRPGEVWGAMSALDKLLVVRTR